jgi:hypothetical protein
MARSARRSQDPGKVTWHYAPPRRPASLGPGGSVPSETAGPTCPHCPAGVIAEDAGVFANSGVLALVLTMLAGRWRAH